MNYHKAGCPKLLALKWHEGRNDLSAYYWFDEQMAPQSFYSLLMMNADGRSDVLLRIDTRANQYEIAIKGEYLVEPIAHNGAGKTTLIKSIVGIHEWQ